ncbi:von Willebrand factor A domain-containing protein 5A, partial [Tupaia chinensis]|uniref:von Willebrand factor A domain-containing protein 5A n=1 Tax=Tupaia chinensis TaxID=246437 RepID=UPI0003C8D7F3
VPSASVTLAVHEFVAGVSATLHYENEEKAPLETFFVFPMDEDSAVYSFEALVDGKKIVAELQDKMKAHTDYENALSQGHQAFLLEEDGYSRDVFCCNVGNLQPGSKAALTLRYVQELPLEADGALRCVLPAVLNPRYQLSRRTKDSCVNMKTPIVPPEDLPYTLSMVATISSQHGIERVQSNCSLSPVKYLGDDKTTAQVSLTDGHKFDRDVELLIYYSGVHSPTVAVETGMPAMEPECVMGDPSAMVSFYPDIPEAQSPVRGEFVFLMDRSGSMQSPMSVQDRSQLRIEAAKETLILLLKSLPIGCYFNVYGFGSSYKALFRKSVEYTQETMKKAVERIQVMQADLGGTEILAPLQKIYKAPSIPGYPLQLFVFTDGEVTDTFSVIQEVKTNRQKHRCFAFGIGEGASTSLIKGIARVSGGASEFITGKDRMQSKVLRALKQSLQPVVQDFSLSWDLSPGLSAKMLSPEQTVIFRGQRLIIYAQLTGAMPPAEATGKVCLKYSLQGQSLEEKVTFSLQPKPDANFTIHRLAAKSLIQAKDMGSGETPASDKKDVLNISMASGVLSSFTAFIAINKELNKPVQGPMTRRDIPRPMLLGARAAMSAPLYLCGEFCLIQIHKVRMEQKPLDLRKSRCFALRLWIGRLHGAEVSQGRTRSLFYTPPPAPQNRSEIFYCASMTSEQNDYELCRPMAYKDVYDLDFEENGLVQLISLQNANGSWDLNEDLAKALGMSLEDMNAACPDECVDSSDWATV